jgi:hypothetical protein
VLPISYIVIRVRERVDRVCSQKKKKKKKKKKVTRMWGEDHA